MQRPLGVSARALAQSLLVLACGAGRDASWRSPVEAGDAPGGTLTSPNPASSRAFSELAPIASSEQRLYFNSGVGFVVQPWLVAPAPSDTREGLGPLYNAAACVECHLGGGRGRPPFDASEAAPGLVLRMASAERGPHGEPLPDPVYGEQLQTRAVSGVASEGTLQLGYAELAVSYADGHTETRLLPRYSLAQLGYGEPGAELRSSPRVAPALIGLGLLEAIPEARLEELADPEDQNGDGISGRLQRVWDVARQELALGRFGWKAEQPNLRQQTAAALSQDLGVTSELYPEASCSAAQDECRSASTPESDAALELSERVLDRMELYLRLLAVPARRAAGDPTALEGRELFEQTGCAACHVPSHVTSPDAALPELADQTIWPYTDLLLHDLGPELADDRPSFAASSDEWRTAPLWGIGLYALVSQHERLLHDGRARGVAEAIAWHGGEAAASRARFGELPAGERAALIRFVESL